MRPVILSLSFMISNKGNNPENISNLSKTTRIEIELRVLTQPVPPYGEKGDDASRGGGWGGCTWGRRWIREDHVGKTIFFHRQICDSFIFFNIHDKINLITKLQPYCFHGKISSARMSIFSNFYCSCFTMLCSFLLYSKVNQLNIYICPLFCTSFPLIIGHRWAPSRVPCATQQVLIESESVVTQSCPTLWSYGRARLLCPWGFLGKNTRVSSHSLLQGSSQLRDWT